jgi:hypothetical protein
MNLFSKILLFTLWATVYAMSGIFLLGLGEIVIVNPKFLILFPGDWPAIDHLLRISLLTLPVVLVVRGIHWLLRKKVTYGRWSKIAFRMFMALTSLFLIFRLYRFGPAWQEVRENLNKPASCMLRETKGDPGPHMPIILSSLEKTCLPKPVSVQLGGFGFVEIVMDSVVYPFVSVNFKNGYIGRFDLRTMHCFHVYKSDR